MMNWSAILYSPAITTTDESNNIIEIDLHKNIICAQVITFDNFYDHSLTEQNIVLFSIVTSAQRQLFTNIMEFYHILYDYINTTKTFILVVIKSSTSIH